MIPNISGILYCFNSDTKRIEIQILFILIKEDFGLCSCKIQKEKKNESQ